MHAKIKIAIERIIYFDFVEQLDMNSIALTNLKKRAREFFVVA